MHANAIFCNPCLELSPPFMARVYIIILVITTTPDPPKWDCWCFNKLLQALFRQGLTRISSINGAASGLLFRQDSLECQRNLSTVSVHINCWSLVKLYRAVFVLYLFPSGSFLEFHKETHIPKACSMDAGTSERRPTPPPRCKAMAWWKMICTCASKIWNVTWIIPDRSMLEGWNPWCSRGF